MACGAALENLHLSALNKGLAGRFTFPEKDGQAPLCVINFETSTSKIIEEDTALYHFIGKRCTNRKKSNGEKIERSILDEIRHSISDPFEMRFTENSADIKLLAEIIASAEKIRFMHPQGHEEFFEKEIRWTKKEIEETRDGLDVSGLELSNKELTGLKISADKKVIDLLRHWGGGNGLKKLTYDSVLQSAAIGLIAGPQKSKQSIINAGRVIQRVWLKSNQINVSFHPVSSPVFFFDRIKRQKDLTQEETKEILDLENKFSGIFTMTNTTEPYFLFRLFKAEAPSAYSLRRPLEDCFINAGSHD
jgi:hypothetical protein